MGLGVERFFGDVWSSTEEHFGEEIFWKRASEVVGFLFSLRGVGINLSPRPMTVVRDGGTWVMACVRSCIAMLLGREK